MALLGPPNEETPQDATLPAPCQPSVTPACPTAKQQDLMMLDGFMMYLLSAAGDILNQEHTKVHQDMSQPLSHYFISSSHNTYLTRNQIGGSSSTEAYVRCVSLVPTEPRRSRGSRGTGTHLVPMWWQGAEGRVPLCGAGLLGGPGRGTCRVPRAHAHLQNPLP